MKWYNFKSSKFINISKLGIANVAGSIISAGLWFLIAGMIQAEQYGEISYLLAIGGIIVTICLIGGPQTIMVYSAKKIKLEGTVYFISLISSLISGVILYIFLQNLEIGIFVIGSVIYNLIISELLGKREYNKYSTIFLIQKILQFALAISFYFVFGKMGIILGIAISLLVTIKYFYETLKENKIDFLLLKSKAGFLTNIYIRDLGRAFNGNIDKIIIGPLLGFALLGNYYLGLQVLSVLSIIPGIITNFIIPEEASGNSTKKIKIITIIGSFFLALLGIFVAPVVLPLYFPEYSHSIELVPVLSLAVIPSTVSSMIMSTFLSDEKSRPILIGYAISTMVLIIGIVILSKDLGALGVAISYVAGQTSNTVFLLIVRFSKFMK